ncbi:hypothetical protein HU200_013056 [Digitaria exilis]|uniref:Gnk2-homologous domain-containing protein n=1 Tax=Digitaria exilis TaxID=1010633 RepID=A0A835FD87_9POAL|nr:hypothetical protein HU200_013056 [Digitaria exilis]
MAMDAHHHHHRLPSYLAAALFLAFALAPLAAGDPLGPLCGTSGNYTLNDTYQGNIQRLAATLPKNTSSSQMLFAKAQLGAAPNIVYALALCRGDTNASACGSCVATAFSDAQQLCAYNKDATIFYDLCLLRYSNQDFLGLHHQQQHRAHTHELPERHHAVQGVRRRRGDPPQRHLRLRGGQLVQEVRHGGGSVPELRQQESDDLRLGAVHAGHVAGRLRSCLSGIIKMGPKLFQPGSRVVGILGLRCNYRYEQYSFFSSTPLLQLPDPAVEGPAPAPAPPAPVIGTPPTSGGGEFAD